MTCRFHVERFNLKKLNEAEGKEQYRDEISNTLVGLKILKEEVDKNGAWENIRENINISTTDSLS
jgi:hypothetical protein